MPSGISVKSLTSAVAHFSKTVSGLKFLKSSKGSYTCMLYRSDETVFLTSFRLGIKLPHSSAVRLLESVMVSLLPTSFFSGKSSIRGSAPCSCAYACMLLCGWIYSFEYKIFLRQSGDCGHEWYKSETCTSLVLCYKCDGRFCMIERCLFFNFAAMHLSPRR